ncbi:MAG TPA: hypothetical protein VEP90_24015 [Methylomirabilota bacterium]|nr:hypothetical protein [Methylomirabilota bacterium]
MKKILSKQILLKLGSVLGVLLLAAYFVPRIYATNDFTVSNVTFDPATGYLTFDYTGGNLTGNPAFDITDTSGSTDYWVGVASGSPTGNCTSSHCWGVFHAGSPDSGVSTVKIVDSGLKSQDINYPLPVPTTYTPQNPSAGVQTYQVNATDGQTTTSGSYSNMASGTQSITLATKSLVYVTAHANAYASGGGLYSYIRTVYNNGADTEIGTQGYTNATSDGQAITAGGVVTLNAGTYTIAMQKKVYLNPGGTATFYQPGMAIVIIPIP